jgi:SPP1 family predicted phage head-tail adaptor
MGKPDVRIAAGELRHRVTFLRRKPEQDAMGQPSTEFDELFTAWAGVGPANAREYFAAGHYVDEVDTEIRLRYLPHAALRATDEAQVAGEQGGRYGVVGVLNPDQANRAVRVLAKRIT